MNSGTAAARTHLLSWGGPVQATNRIERGYRWWALGAVLLVMFTASISSTIVSTAVPTIVGDLHGFTLYAWVFFVTLPLVAVAGLIVGAILPRVRTPHERGQLDVSGSVLMTGGLVAVLLGFTWGGSDYAWLSWQEVMLFVLGVLLLVGLVPAERRASAPLLSPSFFRKRVFALSVVISFLISVAMFGGLTFIPLFVQGVVGKTAQNSGVVLTPMMLSFMVGSGVGGQIVSRTGRYRLQAVIGMACGVVGMVMFSRLQASSGSGEVIRDMLVLGLGSLVR